MSVNISVSTNFYASKPQAFFFCTSYIKFLLSAIFLYKISIFILLINGNNQTNEH